MNPSPCQQDFNDWAKNNDYIPDKTWDKPGGSGVADSIETPRYYGKNTDIVEAYSEAAARGSIPGVVGWWFD